MLSNTVDGSSVPDQVTPGRSQRAFNTADRLKITSAHEETPVFWANREERRRERQADKEERRREREEARCERRYEREERRRDRAQDQDDRYGSGDSAGTSYELNSLSGRNNHNSFNHHHDNANSHPLPPSRIHTTHANSSIRIGTSPGDSVFMTNGRSGARISVNRNGGASQMNSFNPPIAHMSSDGHRRGSRRPNRLHQNQQGEVRDDDDSGCCVCSWERGSDVLCRIKEMLSVATYTPVDMK